MIVRPATLEDLPAYMPLALAFHAASPIRQAIPFSVEGFADFYTAAIESQNMGVWLAEQDGRLIGICGALVYPMYFNPDYWVAQELWWYLSPEARGHGAGKAMYDAIDAWATEKGASALFMIALEDERASKMEKLYVRQGFQPMERTFYKEVA